MQFSRILWCQQAPLSEKLVALIIPKFTRQKGWSGDPSLLRLDFFMR